jgi:hypothetical protein
MKMESWFAAEVPERHCRRYIERGPNLVLYEAHA